MAHHVLALVPLAPVDQGPVPEGLPDGRAEPLAAIQDHQHALGEVEAPLDQRPQERRQHRRVLRVRFDEAEEALLPRQRDAQRDDHRRVGERLAVQEHGHHVLTGQVPLLERPQLRRAGLDEAPGHRRTREPDRPGNHRGGGLVVAAGDPVEHPPQQQVVHITIATHRLVGPQRDLAPRDVANAGHTNRHTLPRQTHRPRVAAVTAPLDRLVFPGVARAGQRRHFLVEQLLHVQQAQRDQGADQLHLGVQL